MSSRGVVFGDLFRANDEFNGRVGAAAPDTDGPGVVSEISGGTGGMMHADLFDPLEAAALMGDLVRNYTSMTGGMIYDATRSMATHAAAIGVLTERQRWETTAPVEPVAMSKVAAHVKLAIEKLAASPLAGDVYPDVMAELQRALAETGVLRDE